MGRFHSIIFLGDTTVEVNSDEDVKSKHGRNSLKEAKEMVKWNELFTMSLKNDSL